VLGVLRPGEHGSTFGGNPLACAVGRAVIAARKRRIAVPVSRVRRIPAPAPAHVVKQGVAKVIGRGLWAGVHIAPGGPMGRQAAEALIARVVQGSSPHDIADISTIGHHPQRPGRWPQRHHRRAHTLIRRLAPVEIMAHGGLTARVSRSLRSRSEREENLCATGSCGIWGGR
jgi:hypothetical protein